jgi:hypothetical protein
MLRNIDEAPGRGKKILKREPEQSQRGGNGRIDGGADVR